MRTRPTGRHPSSRSLRQKPAYSRLATSEAQPYVEIRMMLVILTQKLNPVSKPAEIEPSDTFGSRP